MDVSCQAEGRGTRTIITLTREPALHDIASLVQHVHVDGISEGFEVRCDGHAAEADRLSLHVHRFVRRDEDGHGSLGELERRLVQESCATQDAVDVALDSESVVTGQ